MTAPHDAPQTPGPYAHAAPLYWAAGWHGILPLPPKAKKPVPTGYTGAAGRFPSYPDIHTWTEGPQGGGNIALRLPHHIIGIDVDNYDDKPGAATLTQLETAHGPLPPTWRSTSRGDGVSGIRLYRVPEGLNWPGDLGGGIEIIQHRHRYTVAWPSVHPTGNTYRWINPDGADTIGEVPDVDELPDLPDTWIQAITRGEAATDIPRLNLDTAGAGAWLDQRAGGVNDPPCPAVRRALARHVTDLTQHAHARHQIGLQATARLVHLAGEGHAGTIAALTTFKKVWEHHVTTGADRPADPGEWDRFLSGAIQIAAAAHPDQPAGGDPCDNPFHGLLAQKTLAPAATLTPSTTPPAAASPAPATNHAEAEADDQFEQGILRNQLLNQEIERQRAQRGARQHLDDEEAAARHLGTPDLLIDGASFILDTPERVPSIWGRGKEVAWAEGESLMLVGPPGVGKTTVAGQIIRARLGLTTTPVLDLDVTVTDSKVLYLAMDRPAQAARALRRHFHDDDRDVLAGRLVVWRGPPPADVARNPETLVDLAFKAGADTLVIDSVKDAAIGLSEDDVAAGYNRARQAVLTAGVQLLELHHLVKRGANGTKPTTLADVYGSAWLTAGAGSVILLWGAAGDPVVELHHLKQPSAEIGPFDIVHDHETGTSEIQERVNPVRMAKQAGTGGVTARTVAKALFCPDRQTGPAKADVEKARRRLDVLAGKGLLAHNKAPAGSPDTWTWVQDSPPVPTLEGLMEGPSGGHERGHGATF